MSLDGPFRIDRALADGTLSRDMARSTEFRTLFPKVAIARDRHLSMAVRARAAGLVHERVVVAGVAAAALHRAHVAPLEPTVDLVVDVAGVREVAGLRRRRLALAPDEIAAVDGTRVTTPARTAYDVARWLPRGEAVVVLDALVRATALDADDVRSVLAAHPEDRDRTAVEPALAWLDARSPGPAASRLRVALLARGLPRPLVDRVLSGPDRGVAHLCLAWPAARTGLALHTGAAAGARDVGWEVLEWPDPTTDDVDGLATRLERLLTRWDPPRLLARPKPWWELPLPPDDHGWFDDGRSRLDPRRR
ncbi:hypothetical protein [Actinomycetospora soli]|uniref:hypothetical protein n=1 Tax=Actinomycetospora soli TaxID=2893887 RepID=UPI001E2A792D|nr:hypothetical protein [Actinomycetospora soli]MCD2189221.1 hypothetical protein [Actinomycetospora soli]